MIGELLFAEPRLLLAAPIAALLLLALSLRKRSTRETAYLDLWEQALRATPWRERWLQFLPEARALLLAAAAALLAGAAAGPSHRRPGPREVVYVVDRSATMAAREGSGTRLDAAKSWVLAQLAQHDPRDRVGLAAAGRTLESAHAPSDDRAVLRAALAALAVEPVVSDLEAAAVALEGMRPTCVVVTDAAGEKGAVLRKRPELRVHRVGSEIENAGIRDLEVDDPFPEPEIRVKASVTNRSASPATRELVVGETREKVSLEPGASAVVSLAFPRGAGGIRTIRLEPADSFALDDEATILTEPPESAPLVVISPPESIFVEALARALAKEAGTALGTARAAADAPDDAVLFADGGSFDRLPRRAILFGVAIPGFARPEAGRRGEVVRVRGGDSLLRGLLLDRLFAQPSVRFESDKGALVEGSGGPLVVAREEGDRRVVATAFTLSDSNLPALGGSLPVFARRALRWVLRGSIEPVAFVRTGRDPRALFRGLPAQGPGKLGPWTLPDGRPTTASFLEDADLRPGETPPAAPIPSGSPEDAPIGALLSLVAAGLLAAWALLELPLSVATALRGRRLRNLRPRLSRGAPNL